MFMTFVPKTTHGILLGFALQLAACGSSGKETPVPEAEAPAPVSDVKITGTPLPLSGPYETLEAYCTEFRKNATSAFEENLETWSKQGFGSFTPRCSAGETKPIQGTTGAEYTTSVLRVSSPVPGLGRHAFAIKTAAGWFVEGETAAVSWGQYDEMTPHRTRTTRWSSVQLVDSATQWTIDIQGHFQGHGAPTASSTSEKVILTCYLGNTPKCGFESTTKNTTTQLGELAQ